MEGYYLMPHPPIIVPNIGKGEELKLYQTSLACYDIAQEIATKEPETIIIVTPHGPMFSDAISISDGEDISGDFRRFQCFDIKVDVKLDMEFNEVYLNYPKMNKFLLSLLIENYYEPMDVPLNWIMEHWFLYIL